MAISHDKFKSLELDDIKSILKYSNGRL